MRILSTRRFRIAATIAATIALTSTGFAADAPADFSGIAPQPAADIAREVDNVLTAELRRSGNVPAKIAGDEDFLRRISLDLTGVPPTASEVTLFSLNPDSDKRAAIAARLLDDPAFSENWARYWRDVIFSRATDERTRRFQGVFKDWLTAQLEDRKPWDEITTALITATGDVSEEGATALMMVHGGDAQEIAAETSRIFLGIQIQCANCHDHPTDQWKRQDFHELAAYFPRVLFRPVRVDGQQRSFEVTSFEPPRGRRGGRFGGERPNDPRELFARLDVDGDGEIAIADVRSEQVRQFLTRIAERIDENKDGILTKAEFDKMPAPMPQPGRGSAEYFMPDLSDPASRGTQIDPVFFVNKVPASKESDDLERRGELARQIVAPENPWFARAYVNRIWAELVGTGFYMPVDDLGPERTASHPEVLDLLAGQFATHGYDIRWLFETIVRTEAYQRALDEHSETAFAAATPARLRSDPLFESLMRALGTSDIGGRRTQRGPIARLRSPRAQFSQLFDFDPSTPQADLTGTIPQALFFMNSPIIENAIQAEGRTNLGRILRQFERNDDALRELYLTVLSREPSDQELQVGRDYLAEVDSRNEAFEDLYWALLNSSEFLSKR